MEGVKIEFPWQKERNEKIFPLLKFLNYCFALWGATTSPAAKVHTKAIKCFFNKMIGCFHLAKYQKYSNFLQIIYNFNLHGNFNILVSLLS